MADQKFVSRAVVAVMAISLLTLNIPVHAESLNLGSGAASVQVTDAHTSGPVTLNVGGVPKVVNVGDHLTPAEFAALNQIITGGAQNLGLNSTGQAVSGAFAMHQLPQGTASALAIPQGVTVINDFARTSGILNLAGNLTNSGTFFGVSTNSATSTANISAANIINNVGALLTTVLPVGGLAGYPNAINNLNLNLNAVGDIVNAGTISSAGNLTATAGGSIQNALPSASTGQSAVLQAVGDVRLMTSTLVNEGLISAQNGNVEIANSVLGDLHVNGANGTVRALNGDITVGHATLTTNANLRGGDWLSQALNLKASNMVSANIGQVDGPVNVNAYAMHLAANTDVLTLGDICLKGDPIIANTVGDIVLTSATTLTTNGAPLAIVARGDILVGGATAISIDTSGASAGGDVLMVAGADFTVGGDGSLTITGGTPEGGEIDLSAGPGLISINTRPTDSTGDGGDVRLVAYGGDGTNSGIFAGKVTLPILSFVTTGGEGTGNNGDFWVIAGEHSAQSVSIFLGSVDTTGGNGDGGSIRLFTAEPLTMRHETIDGDQFFDYDSVVVQSSGALSTDHFFYPSFTTIFGEGSYNIEDNGIIAVDLKATGRYLPVQIRAGESIVLGNLSYVDNGQTLQPFNAVDDHQLFVRYDMDVQTDGSVIVGNILTPNAETFVEADNGSMTVNSVDGKSFRLTAGTTLDVSGNVNATQNGQLFAGTVLDVDGILSGLYITVGGPTLGTAVDPLIVASGTRVTYFTDSIYLQSQGDIGIEYGSQADVLADIRTTNNGDIIINGADPIIYFGLFGQIGKLNEQGSTGVTRLIADGSGDIRQQGIVAIFGSELIMESGSGNIGGNNLWSLPSAGIENQELSTWVATPKVEARTTGSVNLIQRSFGVMGITGDTDYLPLANIEIRNSSAGNGKLFEFDNQSPQTTLSLNNITVGSNSTVDIHSEKDIALIGAGGTALSVGAATNVDISADGNISSGARIVTSSLSLIDVEAGGSITNPGFSGIGFEAPEVRLTASNGDIGTSANPIRIKTDKLSILDSNSAFIDSQGSQALALGALNSQNLAIEHDGDVNLTNVVNGGNLSFESVNGSVSVSETVTALGALNLVARTGQVINNTVGAGKAIRGGTISITTPEFVNHGKVEGDGEVAIQSPANSNLTISGNEAGLANEGVISGASITIAAVPEAVSNENDVIFKSGTHQVLQGPATIIANADNFNSDGSSPGLVVESGATVHSHDPLTVFAIKFQQSGTIEGEPIKWVTPRGEGVYYNPYGDLVLSSNLGIDGHHVALLAKGNIIAKPTFTKIDTAKADGHAGNITLIAGYDFNSSPVATGSPAFGSLFTIGNPSSTGGSILMSGVSLNSNATTSAPESGIAGDIIAVAHAGSANAGVVMLKSITATGAAVNGQGGDVLLIGQGGVKVGDIKTTGAYPGSVQVHGAEPQIVNGTLILQDGYVRSGASFAPMPLQAGQGAAVTVGTINASAAYGRAGNVTITSDSYIDVKGGITATGIRSLQPHDSGAQAGGDVRLISLRDNITVAKTIDVSGVGGLGGNAGFIAFSSPATMNAKQNLLAKGADFLTGAAGNGGGIVMTSTDELGSSLVGGSVIINGYVDAHGGKGTTGGDGGGVVLGAGTVRVLSKSGAYSINAQSGAPSTLSGTAGDAGSVFIFTYATQEIPKNFDLQSTKASEVALPGGRFTVGMGTPIVGYVGIPNGTAGGIVTGSSLQALLTGSFTQGVLPTAPGVYIGVTGGSASIKEEQVNGFDSQLVSVTYQPHMLVTPARAVALFQVTTGNNPNMDQTMLVASDGTARQYNPAGVATGQVGQIGIAPAVIRMSETDIRQSFSAFRLSAGTSPTPNDTIQFRVDGLRPILDLSAAKLISIPGDVSFDTPNVVATLNLGTKTGTATAPLLDASGSFNTSNTGTLVLAVSGTNLKINGTIQTNGLYVLASGGSFVLENTGSILGIGLNPRVVLNEKGLLSNLVFVNTGAGSFNIPFSFENKQLPLGQGSTASRTLPTTAVRNINLQFKLNQPGLFGPIPQTAEITGNLEADSIKITTLINSLAPFKPETDLELDGATLRTAKAITILSAGDVQMLNSVIGAGALTPSTTSMAELKITTTFGLVKVTDSIVHAFGKNTIKTSSFEDVGGSDIGSANSTIKIETKNGIDLANNTYIQSCTGLTLLATSGSVELRGTIWNPKGVLAVTAGSEIRQEANITSGLTYNGPFTGTLAPTDIYQAGSVVFTAGTSTSGAGPSIFFQPGSSITSIGGDIKSVSFDQTFFQEGAELTANGGNVIVLSKASIYGYDGSAANATITARAVGTVASNKGGGVEIASGVTTSGLSAALAIKTVSAPNLAQLGDDALGVISYNALNSGTPSGAILVKGTGPIDLTNGGFDASIEQTGGAILINSNTLPDALTQQIQFEGINIRTYGFKPIAYTSAPHAVAALMQPDEDATFDSQFGSIKVKRGALVAIESVDGAVRVKSCSGPGHVIVEIGGHQLSIAPGQELLVTASAPTDEQLIPHDGVGRRQVSSHRLSEGKHVTVSDFSIISFVQNADYLAGVKKASTPSNQKVLNNLLKTAAAIHTVTSGKRGGYTAKPKAPTAPKAERHMAMGAML